MYTHNAFHFQNHNDSFAFAQAVNPITLSRITALAFDLNSVIFMDGNPYDFQCPLYSVYWIEGVQPQWSNVWEIIAAMDNLTKLEVFLQDPGSPEWDGLQCLCIPQAEILSPLWKVKREMTTFEMNVPWVDTSSWSSLRWSQPVTQGGAPFNLTRRGINPN